MRHGPPGAKTIKKNTNSTQNKSQTHRAKQYEVASFLSTDCELSTETCSKTFILNYSLGPWSSLNRLRTGTGRCKVLMQKWGYNEDETTCECGDELTMKHLLVCPTLPQPYSHEDLEEFNLIIFDLTNQ